MKKILLFFVALVATLSMNAQTTEIHNASGKVASYLGADVTVKFGMDGSDPTIMVYKGDVWQKTYKGSEYKVVSTPIVEKTFKAVYDTNGSANTLTFYYDAVDHSGNGITVYDNLPTAATKAADWGYNSIIKHVFEVVIDTSVKNYSSLTSTAYMFYNMYNADKITGAEHLDVTNVTDMSYMFYAYGNNKNINMVPNVSEWNTSKVTSMKYMFANYGKISTDLTAIPDVSGWKTDKVTDLEQMFDTYGNRSTNISCELDLSGWNLANVTSATNVFNFSPKTFSVTIPAKTGKKSNEGGKWYYGDGTKYITPPTGKTFTPPVSVTFVNPEGDVISTMPETQYIQKGRRAIKPSNPKDNTPGNSGFHTLAGWYKTKDATTGELSDPWNFSRDVVTENITLYAQWQTTVEKIIGKAAAPFPYKDMEEDLYNPKYVKDKTTWVGGKDQICYGALYHGNKYIIARGPVPGGGIYSVVAPYGQKCLKTGIAYKYSDGIFIFYIEGGVFTKMEYKEIDPSTYPTSCDGTYTPPTK